MASVVKRTTGGGEVRYDVRYRLRSGRQRTKTFHRRKDADGFARQVEIDKTRGGLVDPQAGRGTVGAYTAEWIDQRPKLSDSTRALYRQLRAAHLAPLIDVELARLDPATVRAWNARLVRANPKATTPAKAYRLLRAALNTAVADGLIQVNPCSIEGAGVERSDERPVATVEQLDELADAVLDDRRALVVLAAWGALRLGECLGLARRHVSPLHGTIRVERQMIQLDPTGEQVLAEPKTEAGRRTIHLPPKAMQVVLWHLERYVGPGPDALLFTTAPRDPARLHRRGGPMRRMQWNIEFRRAVEEVGLPEGFRFHDLRHTSLTMFAQQGATVAEIMARAGHSSPAAALRYQHATTLRDQVLAAQMETPVVQIVRDGRAIEAQVDRGGK